jgi:hypothetical protein
MQLMPRTREPQRFTVRVRVGRAGDPGFYLAGFFDMMRYDGATVEKWDREDSTFVVTLKSSVVTPGRWASMGLPVKFG